MKFRDFASFVASTFLTFLLAAVAAVLFAERHYLVAAIAVICAVFVPKKEWKGQ